MVLLMSAYVKYVKVVSPRATVRSSGSTSTARQIGSGRVAVKACSPSGVFTAEAPGPFVGVGIEHCAGPNR